MRVEPYGMFILVALIVFDPQIHLIHTITSTLTHGLSNTILSGRRSRSRKHSTDHTQKACSQRHAAERAAPSRQLSRRLGELEKPSERVRVLFLCRGLARTLDELCRYRPDPRIRPRLLIDWLAAGIDPAKATVFVQSRIPEHAVLHLLLSMIIPVAWTGAESDL